MQILYRRLNLTVLRMNLCFLIFTIRRLEDDSANHITFEQLEGTLVVGVVVFMMIFLQSRQTPRVSFAFLHVSSVLVINICIAAIRGYKSQQDTHDESSQLFGIIRLGLTAPVAFEFEH